MGAVPVGDEFVVKSESVANYSDRHNQRLDASIKAGIGRLARLDELRFYNAEETHSPLSLGQALNDLKSFVSALSQAKPGSDSEVFGWVIVAALGIEELQAELTNRLPTLDNKTRKAIAVALESQPWFGDYAPLSYILKNGTSGVDGDFTATLKALRADVYTDRFWMIIQERIQEQPKLARDIFAQARYARLDHMRQVFECYKKLPAEIAGVIHR
ncbi:MAG: hypothetical protein IPP19_07345 [Verrucomicrobia bacterium]|nr:hypothetical protein [Verrucomicrobiota bacterium]